MNWRSSVHPPCPSIRDSVTMLETLVAGLRVPSETDSPVEVFTRPACSELSVQALLAEQRLGPDEKVDTETAETFFAPLVQQQPWFDEAERATAGRFRSLLEYLQSSFVELRVFRVGQAAQTVLIVGRCGAGDWIGLRTAVVET
jgi:hypothetical protein